MDASALEQKAIVVRDLKKTFSTGRKKPDVMAVDGIGFEVACGERVAFIGPNGAGKSTTIKMLTGILRPTSGAISVLGMTPSIDRRHLAYRIGAVFGQRSQLWYHLPVRESLELISRVYGLDRRGYAVRLESLLERFGVSSLVDRQVRQLSLGERMRFEILACMLHRPDVLFLDEPTIGLDVSAKAIIRDFIREQSAEEKTTILLTSHDPGDIESVCDRVVMINHGRIIIDEDTAGIKVKRGQSGASMESIIRGLYEASAHQ